MITVKYKDIKFTAKTLLEATARLDACMQWKGVNNPDPEMGTEYANYFAKQTNELMNERDWSGLHAKNI